MHIVMISLSSNNKQKDINDIINTTKTFNDVLSYCRKTVVQQGELRGKGPAPTVDIKAHSKVMKTRRFFGFRMFNSFSAPKSFTPDILIATKTNHSRNSTYLEYTLVSGMLLQFNQTIKNNQLHIVVALLDNQINVALGSSLEFNKARNALDHSHHYCWV